MGNFLSGSSTSSTPRLYTGIKLLLADPELQFPEEFDPQRPPETRLLGKVSRQSFISSLERESGAYVVPLEDFVPTVVVNEAPEEVELRDGATYIVVPRRRKSYETRLEGIDAWQKHQTDGSERMLVDQAMNYLKDGGHVNVRPFCRKIVTGPGGRDREIDAAAVADNCAVIIEHKNVMDAAGALQLLSLVNFIKSNSGKGEGSVSQFSGKRIIGVLAGPAETKNIKSKKDMDDILQDNGFLKWFEQGQYGDDPCSPFHASGISCDPPAPTNSPGNGPTAPAAVPRRVGRLLAPMRGSAMLVRPRLANRVGGCRPFF